MEIRTVTTQNAPPAIGPYSQAVIAGEFIFCSGQIPLNANGELVQGDIKKQTRQVIHNLSAVLKAGKSSLDRVVSVTVYLSTIHHFAEFNEAYAEFFTHNVPARTVVESSHLPKTAHIEMDCIAHCGEEKI